MSDHWTLPLSVKGSEEVRKEQETREAETQQRRAMLERVRKAARQMDRDSNQASLERRPTR